MCLKFDVPKLDADWASINLSITLALVIYDQPLDV
jgi:hypothetical protein